MKTFTYVYIFLHFCAVWIILAYPKPVPDLESYPEGCVHSEQKSDLMTARRSITNMDALNPDYLENDPQLRLSREELSDSVKDQGISLDVLNDPVDGFFRGHKDQEVQKPQIKRESGDTPEIWGKDEEMVRRDALSSDEQDECYKQQNIDPPKANDGPPRPSLRLKDYRSLADVNVQPHQRMSSRPIVYKEKGSKKLKEETNDIISLYSDPEKRPKLKKEKLMNTQPKDYALDQPSEQKVYKPVGVKVPFPVYDEDIDFHPDPLQGILDDKYWLDPQEQEAVIRKYIDLARNMQPVGEDYMKRDELREEHVPKSVDSKEAFRNAEAVERECPCREIASCGDCSRGKWRKKSNYSEREVTSLNENFGNRKLLSINYENMKNGESHFESVAKNRDLLNKSNNKGNVFEDGNNSEEYSEDDYSGFFKENSNEEETQVEGEEPSFTSNYFGRKLLSFEEDEATTYNLGYDEDSDHKEYILPEEVQVTEDPLLLLRSETCGEYEKEAKKSNNRRSIIFDSNTDVKDKTFNENHYSSILKPSNGERYEFKLETEKLGVFNKYAPNTTNEFIQIKRPFLNKPSSLERYYVPNKVRNFLQKSPIKQKSTKATTTIDPNLEFAIERNQTFLNVSIEMNDLNVSVTTDMVELAKYHEKRGFQPVAKGRRSYEVPLIKHPHVKTLQDDLTNVKAQESNNTGNATSPVNANSSVTISSPVNTTIPTTTSLIVTVTYDYSSNTTDNTTDVTANSMLTQTEDTTTESSTTEKKKKKIEEYDEDSFDAEVANDIVETVIEESQRASVVGHNLGLCRRNSTISKYAKVSPESEILLKKVTECILYHIRDRLEGQSCTLLDEELLQFLKWMVLSGESYKDYIARIKPQLREFKSGVNIEAPAPKIDESAQFSSVAPK